MVGSATKPTGRESARTGQQIEIWSTATIAARERFSRWHEGARALFGMSVESPPDPDFSARTMVRSSGPFRFLVLESSTFQASRSRRDLNNTGWDHYAIYLQLKGRTIAVRDEQAVEFDAGDIGFCDGRQPFRGQFGGRRVVAAVPRAMIERRAPWLRNRPHLKLAPNARFADNLRLHMMDLTAGDAAFSESETGLLADSLCNLVALAAADGIPSGRLQPELQMEALLAFCRQNLGDADLSPQQAADHLGISVRTLHSRFHQIGQTFGHWLLDNRLEGCGAALRDLKQRALNISEIAYRWGFNDLSYFNKAFRARYDMTPGEWRQGSNEF